MKKGFLLGAGFSYDFGMPLASELTEIFFAPFNEYSIQNLVHVLSQNNPYGAERPINQETILECLTLLLKYKNENQNNKNEKDYKPKNYEQFLADIQQLEEFPNKTLSDKDSYSYLFSFFYEIIHSILLSYQEISFGGLYCKNREWFSNFCKLLSDQETWVFTLNHDIYLEALAVDLNIPITYGDSGNISFPISNNEMGKTISLTYSKRCELTKNNQNFYQGQFGINLVKLHGGLSELEYKDRSIICNQTLNKKSSFELMVDFMKVKNMAYYHGGRKEPSGKDRVITNSDGELDIIVKSMLTGGKKYSKTTNPKDGEEKLLIFDDAMRTLDELSIIGYGFGDKHINNRISNAMVLNSNLKIVIIDPVHNPLPDFLEQFHYNLRIKKVQCGIAHWIEYCYTGEWNYQQVEALKANEQERINIRKSVEKRL
ncbi:MAG TPA: hypothetical protein CFH83_07695 [Sulfuricurvum kujiense]|uniref:SIR2-like domain-containing protein n=1 Tax=Sulfuricurvum kujiense TaxID=148813 RepID=A0A2D3WCG7_9BACT|nr:hypothetical protein [Sulfuricurvum kujiense]DAB38108.1 MAG TPA: hypothetical protein CFH83_07695 [Sulfuricurvum kujiense]